MERRAEDEEGQTDVGIPWGWKGLMTIIISIMITTAPALNHPGIFNCLCAWYKHIVFPFSPSFLPKGPAGGKLCRNSPPKTAPTRVEFSLV